MAEMFSCPQCEHEVEPGAGFCDQCGTCVKFPDLDTLYHGEFFTKIEGLTKPSAQAIAEILSEKFGSQSAIDLGCGSGVYIKELRKLGIEVFGVDAALSGLERMDDIPWKRHDLHLPFRLDQFFDLCICFETAEHLRPQGARPLVESLSRLADIVVFSAAVPEQGGDGHLNEQALSYWILLFREFGFELSPIESGTIRSLFRTAGAPFWLIDNFVVFRRSSLPAEKLQSEMARVSSLSGWLSEGEIALLTASVRSLCRQAMKDKELRIVELGSWHGKSTAALASALESAEATGDIHTIDHHTGDPTLAEFLDEEWGNIFSWPIFETTIETLGLRNWVVPVIADALVAAVAWKEGTIDLLFIDGDHEYVAVKKNFEAWRSHLNEDSIIAWHDTTNLEGPCRLVRELIDDGTLHDWIQVDSIMLGRIPGVSSSRTVPPVKVGRQVDPLISIIIAHRNEGSYLRQTIDSLFEHTYYSNFEILILDDASTDGSCVFLDEEPYRTDSRIRLITHNKPQGYLALRRKAVPSTKGTVLQFIDAHHCFTDYWLTNSHDALRLRDYHAIIGQAVTNLDVDRWECSPHACYGWYIDRKLTKIWPSQWHEIGPYGRVAAITGHQLMVSKKGYEDIGGFLPWFVGHGGEDIEFSLRAARVGYDCFVEPTALIGHLFKTTFMNPVLWSDVILNQLITVFVNFGREAMSTCAARAEASAHLDDALKQFESLKGSLEKVQKSVESKSVLSADELLARLPDLGD